MIRWLYKSLPCCVMVSALLWMQVGIAAPLSQLPGVLPRFESVGVGHIPRDVVPAFVQDRAGYLWIATGDGLVRFDGYNYRPQERPTQDPALRNLGWIRTLLAARDGKVWIGTETRGLSAYDPQHDLVADYGGSTRPQPRDEAALQALALPTIVALAEDADGRIYAGSLGGGVDIFDPRSALFSNQRHSAQPGALPDDRVHALLIDRGQTLWVGTWAGLARKRPGGEHFEVVGAAVLAGHTVQTIFEASDGQIWVGTQKGLLATVDPHSGQARVHALPASGLRKAPVTRILETPNHALWVARSGGIQILDARRATLLQELRHDVRRPAGLAGNDVTHMLLDRAGWLWVSGYGLGLQRHNQANNSIVLREPDLDSKSPFNHADVRSLLALPSGLVWAGTQSGAVAILNADLQLRQVVAQLPTPVEAMVQTRDGNMWVGGNGRLYQYNAQGRAMRTLAYTGGKTRRLFESDDGGLWIGAQDGVYRLAPAATRIERQIDAQSGPKGEVHAFAQAPDGRIWIGTSQGMYRTQEDHKGLEHLTQQPGETLGSDIVIGLLFDRKGTLWVDTSVGGLHRLKSGHAATTLAYTRVSERHGQVGKPFGANLMEDARGRIWTQMNVYDPDADRLIELSAADGANLGTGWFFAYAQTAQGRMLFGGSKGILVVQGDAFDESTYAPPVQITELRVNGERQGLKANARTLQLSSQVRSFGVEFTALDYAAPARVRYAYKLEGFDPDWIHTGANLRLASYSNLPPGSYTLRIRASNHSGVWSPMEQSQAIYIQAAWWQTTGFAVLVVLLAALAVAALVYLRTHQLQRRQHHLETQVLERTEELEIMTLELQLQQDALEESSLRDPLTGLYNRRFLTQCMDSEIALSVRAHEGSLAYGEEFNESHDLQFFLLDIDHFKSINDTYGHMEGDAVLKQFAQRLCGVFRDGDYLVRWGGEEFLCVARQSPRQHSAELAQRACDAMAREPFTLENGTSIGITCSVGFACFPLVPRWPLGVGWVETVKLADAAMYQAKNAGRNGWCGVTGHTAVGPEELQAWLQMPAEQLLAGNTGAVCVNSRSYAIGLTNAVTPQGH
ncbi:MAG: diguanylate cyclase [Rhodoferax sp.]|nr:diguanylate cyclase [Rhodoferax sp.]